MATLRRALGEKCPHSELFCSAFSRIQTEYGEIQSICKYSVQMRENTNQNNSEYEHFSSSEAYISEATAISMKKLQKQPPGVVLKKRCSENMQLIYRITLMPKCDFNKLLKYSWKMEVPFTEHLRAIASVRYSFQE